MKKYILFVLLSGIIVSGFAQEIKESEEKKVEQYCILRVTGRLFSARVTIDADYGEKRQLGDNRLRDEETGKLVKFNTEVDALNYMGSNGWKLVNAFPVIDNGNSSTQYVFSKRFAPAKEEIALKNK